MRRVAFYSLFAIVVSSCGPTVVYQQMEAVPNTEWAQGLAFVHNVEVIDTQQPYDMFLEIRHTGNYPYSNLFLFMRTELPDGRSRTDTIDCLLAKPSGQWYGSGLGDLYSLSIPFRKNVRFDKEGTYNFQMEHGMREEVLDGISDIGLTILNSEE